MSETSRPIIVKRTVIAKRGHHGGAWKVAYADFVTAMMAFFLLMWLLNATTEQQRKGLADYFDPSIAIGRTSSGGRDLLNGDSMTSADTLAHSGKGSSKKRVMGEGRGGEANGQAVAGQGAPDERLPDAKPQGESAAEEENLASVAAGVHRLREQNGLSQHIMVRVVPEGLLIEVVDSKDSAMFSLGSAQPSERMDTILKIVAEAADTVTNDMVVIGHTDATPFRAQAGRDNLDLSMERANAARRLLQTMLRDSGRLIRVEGRGHSDLLVPQEPGSPTNRRIGLLILS
ncbi:MAG TPA: flagellar motor protein MotB [Alphaproteobacteria bacterium]|nr:flagellar motor protein MotB [Alphaproteobacteria bacterium]